MSRSEEVVEQSYAACRRAARGAGSSFYPAFFGLPPDRRRAMDALYAFLRHTDDLADEPGPVEVRRQALTQWRAALQAALEAPGENLPSNLLPALADTVRRFAIPAEHLTAVIDGVEMDLTRTRYESFDELTVYCQRVASAVGLACIHIWGFRGPPALEPARKCGVALQLTNILRDLREDLQRDRVYLPLEDLRQFDYGVDELRARMADERFLRLMQFETARAERFYREGGELLGWLEPGGRRVFGMIVGTYAALLGKIKRRPAAVLRRRVRLGKLEKLRLAARWMLLPPRPPAP